jgi:ABC-type dipeptide/oligopeptide/nickel transport system ATPase subunit
MKIVFELSSEPTNTFRCIKAANSVDLDLTKKLKHSIDIDVDFPEQWSVGLIVGASGSGKTTLAKHLYGNDCFQEILDPSKPVIEQFDKALSYDECVNYLCSVGLSQVPCWVRPAATLSNGQRFRAEIALQLAQANEKISVIDEWTSVVDRTVAKVMSHAVQKHARRVNRQLVLCSCHYDVIEWLQPDWVIDCNTQEFRRLLRGARSEKLEFTIKEIDSKSWKYFNKYHYLSDKLAGGHNYFFGLFHNDVQIGFQAFSNYVPHRKGTTMILHFNRTVVHPDYVGFGLEMRLIDETSAIMAARGFRIMGKFSSISVYKSMIKNPKWVLRDENIVTSHISKSCNRFKGKNISTRQKQKWWSFEYINQGESK